ncbi:MAG: hypothetical protein ABIK53_04975 [bacterium]
MKKLFLFLGIFLLVSGGKGICVEQSVKESALSWMLMDMVADNDGNFYVSAFAAEKCIVKFNDKFQIDKDFGENGLIKNKKDEKKIILFENAGVGRLAIDKEYLYVADFHNGLLRFDLSGKRIPLPEGSDIAAEMPQAVTADSNQNIYTSGWQYIKKFLKDGSLDKNWGAGGKITTAADSHIRADKKNNLYASFKNTVTKYTPYGKKDLSFGEQGSIGGDEEFEAIINIALDEDENLYVADYAGKTVKSFTPDGQFIASYDAKKKLPCAVAVYKDRLYVSIWSWPSQLLIFNRITKVSQRKNHFLYVSKIGKVPKIDGKLNETFWKESTWLPLSVNRKGVNENEKTYFSVARNNRDLYLGFECFLSKLNPVLNLLSEVLPEVKNRDGRIWNEDVVEVFLSPEEGMYYHVAVNGLGTVYDAICKGGKGESRDTGWNCPGLKVASCIDEKKWSCEMKIPLSSIGLDKKGIPFTITGNFYREFAKEKIESAWSPTGGSYHHTDKFGDILVGNKSYGIKVVEKNFSSRGFQTSVNELSGKRLSLEVASIRNNIPIKKALLEISPLSKEDILLPLDKKKRLQRIDYLIEKERILSFAPSKKLKAGLEASLTLQLKGADAALYFNKKLLGKSNNFKDIKIEILKGNNTLALAMDKNKDKVELSGFLKYKEHILPLDVWVYNNNKSNNWDSPDSNDSNWEIITGNNITSSSAKFYLRRNIIYKHTIFAPQWDDDNSTGYFAQGTMQRVGVRYNSPFPWKCQDMVLNLVLPEELELPLYQPEKRAWSSAPHKFLGVTEIEEGGRKKKLFKILFTQKVPKQKKYNFYGSNLHLYFKVNKVSDGKDTYNHSGAIWHEWRKGADIELKNDLKIVVLPEPQGKMPKDIILEIGDGMIKSLVTQEEFLPYVETFKLCGFNTMDIDDSHGSTHLVNEKAYKSGFRLHYMTSGPSTTGIVRDYVRKHPQSAIVNKYHKPQSWQAFMCPLYFMEEGSFLLKDALKKYILEEKASIVCYDLEAGPFNSCFCERCRKGFSKYLGTNEIYTQDEILSKYRNEWIKYVCSVHQRIAKFYKKTIKSLSKDAKFSMYSGYENDALASAYGVDWSLYKNICDVFMFGYGRNPSVIVRTKKAIGNKRMLLGEHLDTNMFERAYVRQDVLKSIVFRRLVDGDMGGCIIWFWPQLDGRGMVSFGETSRAIAAFEDIFLSGEDISLKKACQGLPQEDVFAYRKGDDILFVLFNDASKSPKNFTINLPGNKKYQVLDFYSQRRTTVSNFYSSSVPGKDTSLVKFSPVN